MRIAIVDDRADDRNRLLTGVERWAEKNGVPLTPPPAVYESAEAFLDMFETGQYDLIFLDIYMTGMTGMDAARKIRETDRTCRIVFTTTSTEFAVDSYEVDSSYYLVKPYSDEKLAAAFARCGGVLLERERFIRVPGLYGEERLVLHRIAYTEYEKRKIHVYFMDGTDTWVCMGQNEFVALLSEYYWFCDCIKGMLVSFEAVEKLTEDSFILKSGTVIPISRLKYKDVRERFFDWSFANVRGETL